MSWKKTFGGITSGLLGTALFAMLLLRFPAAGMAEDWALGDIPLDADTYQRYLKVLPHDRAAALATSYDARNDKIVTPAKNQASCGGCWSFASVGAFESHLLKTYGGSAQDLAEQQQISCNAKMSGCCGGSMEALQYWEKKGPVQESCLPYGESGTSCPTESTVGCSEGSGCAQDSHRVTNYHTVSMTDPAQVKTSVVDEGPSYFRFDVYEDFYDFWNKPSPGAVYVNANTTHGNNKLGGHAILIIGWNDSKNAYLFKNSWGATGGPNGDGTFWMAISGHYKNLNFQMANFSLTVPAASWETTYPSLFGDQATLKLFREYRNRVLLQSAWGRIFVKALYMNSGEALQVLHANPALMAQARALIARNKDAVADAVAGDEGVLDDTDAVLEFLDRFGAKSPLMLKGMTKLIQHQMLKKQQQGGMFYGFRLN